MTPMSAFEEARLWNFGSRFGGVRHMPAPANKEENHA